MSAPDPRQRSGWFRALLAFLFAVTSFTAACSSTTNGLPEEQLHGSYNTAYYNDGKVLGYFPGADGFYRIPLDTSDLHNIIRDPVVAAENQTFYTDSGVDWKSLVRAAASQTGGASTITMQDATNLFNLDRNKSGYKATQIGLAKQLNRTYSKDQILVKYLNDATYFCNGAYGVEAAARIYWGISVTSKAFTLDKAATLAAMLKQPCPSPGQSFNDWKSYILERRNNYVLDQMAQLIQLPNNPLKGKWKLKDISSAQDKSLGFKKHLGLPSLEDSDAPYPAKLVSLYLSRADDKVKTAYKKTGVKVYTTFDPQIQAYASQAITDYVSTKNRGAVVILDQRSGAIQGYVGGHDSLLRSGKDQIDYGLAYIRGGSTSKIFTAASLAKAGVSFGRSSIPGPSKFQTDDKTVWDNHGLPARNYNLVDALKYSCNTCFLGVITGYTNSGRYRDRRELKDDPINPSRVRDDLIEFGGTSYIIPGSDVPKPKANASQTLGTTPMTIVQRAAVMQMLSNHGNAITPWFIEHINATSGGRVFNHKVDSNHPLHAQPADTVMAAAESVGDSGGTGENLGIRGRRLWMKTGTDVKSATIMYADSTYFDCSAVITRPGNVGKLGISGASAGKICQQILRRALGDGRHPEGPFAPSADLNNANGTVIGN